MGVACFEQLQDLFHGGILVPPGYIRRGVLDLILTSSIRWDRDRLVIIRFLLISRSPRPIVL